jgi:putative inorganic carbon (HCO3(-)) transporter
LTLRLPVPIGGDSVMLLAPLYVVIALGTFVLAQGELRALRSPGSGRSIEDRGVATRLLDLGVAVLPALGTLSITWSIDRLGSAEDLAFFYVPFLLLFMLVRGWVADVRDLRPAVVTLVFAAIVAAVVGTVQSIGDDVWWNPKVIAGNRFRADFRTNSIFWDPNIYGRALVVALLALVAWVLVTRVRRRGLVGAVFVAALLLYALWHSYSQSSWFALAAVGAGRGRGVAPGGRGAGTAPVARRRQRRSRVGGAAGARPGPGAPAPGLGHRHLLQGRHAAGPRGG